MTLTADDKGSLTCRDLFPPRASFEALQEPGGRVVLVRLKPAERQMKVVRPIQKKDLWLLPGELDADALAAEINEEREIRDASLLG